MTASVPPIDSDRQGLDPAAGPAAAPRRSDAGPWRTAFRKLMSDHAAIAALVVFVLIVVACCCAPLYVSQVSQIDPFTSNIDGTVTLDGEDVSILEPSTEGLGLGTTPIGPTWVFSTYFLGADDQGRDVFARLLYGGINSLLIAVGSTVICLFFAAAMGVVAGFFGGIVDATLSRILDVIWAFPIFLLAISLSIVLINQSVDIGPIHVTAGSLWLPIFIIGIVYIPYIARPIRGQVLSLKNSEFVLAAIGLGVPNHRILVKDILPNVATTLIVFVPLMMALNMLTESALSFLSIGVQSPDASWGTIIQDGQNLLYTRPMVALAPGIAIAVTVLTLNVFGDGVRDALDPRSKLRIGRD
jgi:peptide/nickel transport system permease protein